MSKTPEDDAVRKLRDLAAEGDPDSLYYLAHRFENGVGVTKSVRHAANYYRKAAIAGCINAQVAMARLCLIGKGVEQDAEEAAEWYRRAAERGHVEAQFNLGEMYAIGRGVASDFELAAYWYGLAAEQGMIDAKIRLARMHQEGKGVPLDPEKAEDLLKSAEQASSKHDHETHSETEEK